MFPVFRRTPSDFFRESAPRLFSRPVRKFLGHIPGLPRTFHRYLDEVRFLEPDVIRVLRRLIQPGWVCADVGAHAGTITVRMAEYCAPGGKVVAFEPIPANFASLQARINDYRYSDRVQFQNCAVANVAGGTLDLFPGEHSTTWSVFGTNDKNGLREKTTVPVTSLDAAFPAGSRLDFIKIDVEGAESLVLQGAIRILADIRPAILVEIHNAEAWAAADLLWENDYRLFELDGTELPRGHHPESPYRHCLALPN